MIRNRVIPITWNQTHRFLEYRFDTFKDPNQDSDWKQAGHQTNCLSVELHQVKQDYPWMMYLHDYFDDLTDINFCFSKFLPGTYFPMHVDRYGFYAKSRDVSDLDRIRRYILFLEDAAPGHFLQVGSTMYHDWPQGLCVGWVNDTPHLAANLGLVDRYTLQITGLQK